MTTVYVIVSTDNGNERIEDVYTTRKGAEKAAEGMANAVVREYEVKTNRDNGKHTTHEQSLSRQMFGKKTCELTREEYNQYQNELNRRSGKVTGANERSFVRQMFGKSYKELTAEERSAYWREYNKKRKAKKQLHNCEGDM